MPSTFIGQIDDWNEIKGFAYDEQQWELDDAIQQGIFKADASGEVSVLVEPHLEEYLCRLIEDLDLDINEEEPNYT